jgi:hypothetical protein
LSAATELARPCGGIDGTCLFDTVPAAVIFSAIRRADRFPTPDTEIPEP